MDTAAELGRNPVSTVNNGVNAPIKANAPGRLDLFFELKTSRGVLFRAFSRGRPSEVSPRREGVRKGPAAETEGDASQHAVGGIARGFFFLFIFIHQFILFLTFFVSPPVDSKRPD